MEIPEWEYENADKITFGDGSLGSASSTVTEAAEHKITNGLHQISVTQTNKVCAENGATEYKIVVPDDVDAQVGKASNLLARRLNEATGAIFEKVSESEAPYSANGKYIYFCCDQSMNSAGVSKPSQDLGASGYYIKTVNNNVFLYVKNVWGANNAAVGFVKYVLGYEMYSDDIVTYEVEVGETVYLPEMTIIDKPDFEYFVPGNMMSSEGSAGMRYFQRSPFPNVNGEAWHNALNYCDPEEEECKTYKSFWYNDSSNPTQLCYTAHGNTTAYNALVNRVYNVIKDIIDKNPTYTDITLTNEDNGGTCTCSACTSKKNQYGAISATNILFCNDVAAKLEAYFAPKGQTVRICFFAYQDTVNPPTKGGISFHKNVGVFYAPLLAQYNKTFYHTNNASYANYMTAWSKLTNWMYIWLYETNYNHYLYPLNSYDTMVESFRFAKSCNAIYMFPEGQFNQGNVTAFGKYKEYLDAKVLWDLNLDPSDLTEDFFNNYFGPAAGPMRTFYEEMQAQLEWIEANNGEIDGQIYNEINKSWYWPKRQLDHWIELCDEAFEMIDYLKVVDPGLYDVYEKHINVERLFPLFARIELHKASYSEETVNKMKEEFKSLARKLQANYKSELGLLTAFYATW